MTALQGPVQARDTQPGMLPDWFDTTRAVGLPDVTGTKAKILDGARRCYLRYGASRFTMTKVADMAGVSRASLYNHYDDRDRLIADMGAWCVQSFLAEVDVAMQQAETLAQQVGAAARIFRRWTVVYLNPELRDTLHSPYEELLLSSEAGPLLMKIMRTVRPYIERARVHGEVGKDVDLDQASEWVARALQSVATHAGHTFDADDPLDIEDFFGTFVGKGFS